MLLSDIRSQGGSGESVGKTMNIDETPSKAEKMTYKSKTHVCESCHLEFSYAQEFRDHLKTHGNFECGVCGKVIAKQGMLTRHYAKFHGLKLNPDAQHVCWICGKNYKSKAAVTYHIATAHNETKLHCDICSKSFGHPKNLKAHMKRHGEKEVSCDKCTAKFYTTSELGYHYNAVHRNARCWKCDVCGKEFNRSCIYFNHMEKHKPKTYECTVCFKMFRRNSHIKAHMKQHLGAAGSEQESVPKDKIKKYLRCKECCALFESDDMLRNHLCGDRSANLMKQYFCDGCNISFHSKEDLDTHICSHSSAHILVQSENIAENVQIYAESSNLQPDAIMNSDDWDTCFVVLG